MEGFLRFASGWGAPTTPITPQEGNQEQHIGKKLKHRIFGKKLQPTNDKEMVYLSNYHVIDRERVGKAYKQLLEGHIESHNSIQDIKSLLEDNIKRAKQYNVDFDNMLKFAEHRFHNHARNFRPPSKHIPRLGLFTDKGDWKYDCTYEISEETDHNSKVHICVIRKQKEIQQPPDGSETQKIK